MRNLQIILLFASCGTTAKNKRTTTASIDSTIIKEKDNLIRDAREKISYLENELRELQVTGFTFNNCDTAATRLLLESIKASYSTITKAQADSFANVLRAKDNTVRFYADGSAEAIGALRTANYSKTILQRQLSGYMEKVDSFARVLEQEKKNVKIEVKEVEKVKKVTVFPWWLVIVAAVTGLIAGVLEADKIKKLIPF